MSENTKPRVVVCAACRKDDVIVCGARHFDTIMRAQIARMNMPYTNWEQGFIDQFGTFLTREEAYKLALKMGQRKYRCGGDSDKLFSENLY